MIRRFLRGLTATAGALLAVAGLATPSAAVPADPYDVHAMVAVQNILKGELGGEYAYSWMDRTGRTLVVGITNATRGREVRDYGAVPVVVRHSAAELDATKSALDTRARTSAPPAAVTGWYVDVTTNQVVVTTLRVDAESLAFAHSVSGPVRVERVMSRPQPMFEVAGGDGLVVQGRDCSVGFNARDLAGRPFVITAGHCTQSGGTATAFGMPVGRVVASSFPGNDFGVVAVTNPAVQQSAMVRRFPCCPVFPWGVVEVPIGGPVCRSGFTSGWACGIVEAVNQTVIFANGMVTGLTRASVCSAPGDSGGPLVSNPTADSDVQAQGILSGGIGTCATGGKSLYQPITEVLDTFNLVLY